MIFDVKQQNEIVIIPIRINSFVRRFTCGLSIMPNSWNGAQLQIYRIEKATLVIGCLAFLWYVYKILSSTKNIIQAVHYICKLDAVHVRVFSFVGFP